MCAGKRTSLRRQAACHLQPLLHHIASPRYGGKLCLKDMSTRPGHNVKNEPVHSKKYSAPKAEDNESDGRRQIFMSKVRSTQLYC